MGTESVTSPMNSYNGAEHRFTTKAWRGKAATKISDYSRKGAKHVLSNVEGATKKLNFRTWRSWRLGGSKSLV